MLRACRRLARGSTQLELHADSLAHGRKLETTAPSGVLRFSTVNRSLYPHSISTFIPRTVLSTRHVGLSCTTKPLARSMSRTAAERADPRRWHNRKCICMLLFQSLESYRPKNRQCSSTLLQPSYSTKFPTLGHSPTRSWYPQCKPPSA